MIKNDKPMGLKKYFVQKMLDQWNKRDMAVLSAQSLPDGVQSHIDIPYVTGNDNGHLLDIYYPENFQKKLSVIIDIHGGGFIYGDKSINQLYGYYLAKEGYTVFNVNYRLAFHDTDVRGQIQDIITALNWIDAHLDHYPARRDRIFLIGDSAGGVLAVMAALIAKSPRLQTMFESQAVSLDIKALGIISGMMQFCKPGIAFWGLRSMCLEKGYRNAPYYKNLQFDCIPEMIQLPPVHLSTSDDDELNQMSHYFEKVLQQHHVRYKLNWMKKKANKKLGHIFSVLLPSDPDSAALTKDMLAFFESTNTD